MKKLIQSVMPLGYLIVICLLVSPAAHAATYYVSLSGSDSNSCSAAQSSTPSNQKQTISAGVACLFAGDTLYIHGGTYTGLANSIDSGASTVRGGTSSANPITIAAFPAETVTIMIGSNSLGNGITLTSAAQQYLIFDRLIFDGTGTGSNNTDLGAGGLYVARAPMHIRFQNGEIRNFPGQGVLIGGESPGFSSDLQMLYNHIHHNGHDTAPQTHNMYITSDDNLFEGNEIDHAASFGITIYSAHGQPSRNIVRNNWFHDNCIYHGAEIGIDGGNDNQVYNNVLYGTGNGYGILDEFAAPNRTLIANNTIVMNGGIRLGSDSTNAIVKNNIVRKANNSGAGPIDNSGTGASLSNNLTSDPSFVNLGAEDFHLQSNSAAIDAGVTVSPVFKDLEGVSRPQGSAYDIGAFESRNATTISPCDVNASGGSPDVVDVQLCANQAIGVTPCTADINQDGICNVIDVQRVVNAALGGQCVSP